MQVQTKVCIFGNTGTFGTYSYAAQISQPYAMVLDNNGNGNNIAVKLTDYAIDEVNPNISNIVDMGNNKVAMVLNYSNRDSAVVAICDYSLNIQKMIYDNRIGASVGAQRSVRYTQNGADDNGNIYIFSGSSATDSKVGALRIKKGETEFDKNYKFDILAKADGYRFRKAFHISGSKFLLEFYTNKEKYGNMDASGKMAVVDMDAQTLTWVTGLPDASTVSFGWGDGYAGAYYLPVAAPTSNDMQPWHFVVLKDQKSIEKYAASNKYHAEDIKKTPIFIFVCADTTRMGEGQGKELWVQDCSAVSENILLAAHAMGLGACWTTIYPIQKKVGGISRTLKLPANLIPLNAIIIGYPDEPLEPKNKWDEKKITYGIPE